MRTDVFPELSLVGIQNQLTVTVTQPVSEEEERWILPQETPVPSFKPMFMLSFSSVHETEKQTSGVYFFCQTNKRFVGVFDLRIMSYNELKGLMQLSAEVAMSRYDKIRSKI